MAIINRKKRREKCGGGKVQKKRKKKMMMEGDEGVEDASFAFDKMKARVQDPWNQYHIKSGGKTKLRLKTKSRLQEGMKIMNNQ